MSSISAICLPASFETFLRFVRAFSPNPNKYVRHRDRVTEKSRAAVSTHFPCVTFALQCTRKAQYATS